MSSTRSRNKLCLSLENSSTNTFSNVTHLNRWSEVVPPKNALTFAALWDPDDGMVTFSGAALLESESLSGNIFEDDHSQFVTIDRSTDGGHTLEENTATLSTFQDVFKAFIRRTSLDSREHLNPKSAHGLPRALQTRASSTFDGLDVYSHDVPIEARGSVHLSCMDLLDIESSLRMSTSLGKLRLRSDLMLDSCRSESESEPSSESRPSYLKSRFSMTTTSTSNYVDVTSSTGHSTRMSETLPILESPLLESPLPESPIPEYTPEYTPEWSQSSICASPAGSWPYLPPRRRVLRKRRPFDGDATTTTTSSIPSTPQKLMTPKSSMSPFLASPSLSPRVYSSSSLAIGEDRRGRFPLSIGGPISPAPTPPSTPSKGPRLKLRLSFLPKRKSRLPSPDTDGWVCIEVTPFIREHLVENPDED